MAYYFPSPSDDTSTYCNRHDLFDEVTQKVDDYITAELLKALNETGRIPVAGDVKYIFVTKSGPGPLQQSSSESLLHPQTGLPVEPGPRHKRMRINH